MAYLWIRNWSSLQHYKDRNPPWIKFYVTLLDDPDLRELPVPTRLLWDQLLLLAARYGNPIERDAKLIASLTRMPQRSVDEGLASLLRKRLLIQTQTRRKRASPNTSPASKPASTAASKPASPRARPRAREEDRGGERTPPTPPEGGNGYRRLTIKELRTYTGCKATRGSHGAGHRRDPLGHDKPPPDWPHPKPTREQVEAALAAAAKTYPDEPPTE